MSHFSGLKSSLTDEHTIEGSAFGGRGVNEHLGCSISCDAMHRGPGAADHVEGALKFVGLVVRGGDFHLETSGGGTLGAQQVRSRRNAGFEMQARETGARDTIDLTEDSTGQNAAFRV